jgi:hypothetical protein
MAEGLSATAGTLATGSQMFLGDALGLSASARPPAQCMGECCRGTCGITGLRNLTSPCNSAISSLFRATSHDKQGLIANTSGYHKKRVELGFSAFLAGRGTPLEGLPKLENAGSIPVARSYSTLHVRCGLSESATSPPNGRIGRRATSVPAFSDTRAENEPQIHFFGRSGGISTERREESSSWRMGAFTACRSGTLLPNTPKWPSWTKAERRTFGVAFGVLGNRVPGSPVLKR